MDVSEEYAFPSETPYAQNGMTLRDWFAGQALNGWMASFTPSCSVKAKHCAELAYELADAMMEARKQ